MIRLPCGPALQIYMFLTDLESEMLKEVAAEIHSGWTRGRQEGFYFKLDIKELIDQGRYDEDLMWLSDIGDRGLGELRSFTSQSRLHDSWDAYLLFYPDGSSIPEHRDPAPEGMKHVRLNAVVRAPSAGGALRFTKEDGTVSTQYNFRLNANEALIFSPSEFVHAVDAVVGPRLVLSLGCLVPA